MCCPQPFAFHPTHDPRPPSRFNRESLPLHPLHDLNQFSASIPRLANRLTRCVQYDFRLLALDRRKFIQEIIEPIARLRVVHECFNGNLV
jgi:hypothetical protein